MAEILIESAPDKYKQYLRIGDAHNGPTGKDGKINDQKEAERAADLYCRTNVQECQEFLNYLEANGYRDLKITTSTNQNITTNPPASICPPSLAKEGTIPIEGLLTEPAGKRKSVFKTRADISYDLTGDKKSKNKCNDIVSLIEACKPGSEFVLEGGGCRDYRNKGAGTVPLFLSQHPADKKKEPVPVVSGIGFDYTRLRVDLTEATHVQIRVKVMTDKKSPRSKGFVILEIYDADNLAVNIKSSKNPDNRWLPRKDIDLFKVRIPVESTGEWQTLTVPLSRFIDWNRKRSGCNTVDPGVNEDIGDGILNPKKKESFQFQVILEAEDYDKHFGAYISEYAEFVKFERIFSFERLNITIDPAKPGHSKGRVAFIPEKQGIKIINTAPGPRAIETTTIITPDKVEISGFGPPAEVKKTRSAKNFGKTVKEEIQFIRETVLPRAVSAEQKSRLAEITRFLEGLLK
jgi:hypothetical protein